MTPVRRRRATVPALLALAALVVASLGGGLLAYRQFSREDPSPGGRVTEALVVDGPITLVPAFAETPNSRDISALLYRGLTRTGSDGKPVGELARNWSVDAAAKTFTFHLRSGLRWSDGAPITSGDALYTLSVLQSDDDARSAIGQAWSGVSAAAPDPLTITYSLPQSSAAFLSLTTMGLLPEHSLRPRSAKSLRAETDAPSSGPFQVVGSDRAHLVLDRNPHAFERPYLDGLELRFYDSRSGATQALLNGEVDVFAGLGADDARRVQMAVNRQVVTGSTFAYTELLFNQGNAVLADDHVRKAIGLALDRQTQLTSTLGGFATTDDSPIPPAIRWATVQGRTIALNRRAANRELEAAGWRRRGQARFKDGQKLQLKLTTAESQPYSSIAAGIERDLGAVGIGTTTQNLSPETVLPRLQSHQFDMALTALDNGSDPDIFVFWHSSQAGPGGFNFSGMPANAALDRDLEAGRSTTDYATRRRAYLDAQKQILDDHAAVFLYSPDATVGARDTVKGIVLPTGGQRYDLVQGWFVNGRRRL
ncbi:MAG: ABC transporter substrate-binding protein [Candidatus Dormibacteria bacterium]